ncbi:MAG: hypothetical protein HY855_25385 [Burkholderiales bacterium]|nr:hypothetical protein [Burkholderiales bacterium]
MNPRTATGGTGPRRGPQAVGAGGVVALDAVRILQALAQRERYKYVMPRIEPEGEGWKVISPNCSRNIDAAGGEIPIAWLQPGAGGLWTLHARDHAAGRWVAKAVGLTLGEALARLCADSGREFWV